MSAVVLQARGISQHIGTTALLQEIDLKVEAGEMVAVRGPSGSGKSTLLQTLSGMSRPTAGSIELGGEELTVLTQEQLAARRLSAIGFVFQQAELLRDLTMLENVVLPGRLARRVPRAQIAARARALLEQMDVAGLADRFPGEVSGGQAQRVGICRALINDPEIVIADEPTGALDSRAAHEVLTLLQSIAAEGTAVIMVTHDPRMAAGADRVIDLFDGRIAPPVAA
ncbi:ABC transporter ATP-binding protein [Brachybacterium sp. FME24]|uniref:ABC transporter ATP-binding protein n=1 Tax=Brachybacterium sp. FME24 TaxID=2742605 RepID=UPI00186912C5|nr:ABC transporter ATP-binding protein [Brachybacterium sp. FME24]